MAEPTSIRAGDSIAWTRELPYSAADGWELNYRLIGTTGTPLEIPSTGSGTVFSVALAAADTAALTAGAATLVGIATQGANVFTVYGAPIQVLPNLATATTHDGRSPARQALDALKAAYYAWVSAGGAGRKSMTINNRAVTFETPGEMVERIRLLEQEVAREKALEAAVNNGVVPGRIQVRM